MSEICVSQPQLPICFGKLHRSVFSWLFYYTYVYFRGIQSEVSAEQLVDIGDQVPWWMTYNSLEMCLPPGQGTSLSLSSQGNENLVKLGLVKLDSNPWPQSQINDLERSSWLKINWAWKPFWSSRFILWQSKSRLSLPVFIVLWFFFVLELVKVSWQPWVTYIERPNRYRSC